MSGSLVGFFGFGDCGACGRRTHFDPDNGPSVLIDPETKLPPDVGHTDPAKAFREPLCPTCIALVRQKFAERGDPDPWPQWRGFGK